MHKTANGSSPDLAPDPFFRHHKEKRKKAVWPRETTRGRKPTTSYDLMQEWSHVECKVPPVRPKSGEVFLYRALNAIKRSKFECNQKTECVVLNGYCELIGDWRCDQYRWKQNGHKAMPSKNLW